MYIYIDIDIYIYTHTLLQRVHPPAAAAGLPLAVEVNSGHRQAEIVRLREVLGVEILAPPRRKHRLPTQLLEQYEHYPMDPHCWPWRLVTHQFSS